MSDTADRIVAAARACIGVRFVPQGRDPARGLDCVGLAAHALAAGGSNIAVPCDYALRGGTAEQWRAAIGRTCLAEIAVQHAWAGDLLLMRVAPAQFHLGIHSGRGMIHAHAALRRVVEAPGLPAWPVAGAWRLKGEN